MKITVQLLILLHFAPSIICQGNTISNYLYQKTNSLSLNFLSLFSELCTNLICGKNAIKTVAISDMTSCHCSCPNLYQGDPNIECICKWSLQNQPLQIIHSIKNVSKSYQEKEDFEVKIIKHSSLKRYFVLLIFFFKHCFLFPFKRSTIFGDAKSEFNTYLSFHKSR